MHITRNPCKPNYQEHIRTRLSSIESQPKKVIVVVVVVFVVFYLVGVVGDVVGHKNLTLNWACNR